MEQKVFSLKIRNGKVTFSGPKGGFWLNAPQFSRELSEKVISDAFLNLKKGGFRLYYGAKGFEMTIPAFPVKLTLWLSISWWIVCPVLF